MTNITGIFSTRDQAENAMVRLSEEVNYRTKDISIIVREDVSVSHREVGDKGDVVAQGAAGGATTGGVIGGIAGLLVGLGVIAVPGIGGLLIGGPLAAALGLTGAAATTVSGAATGALAGGLVGSLVGLGLPENVAHIYEERVREGDVLLAVSVRAGDANEVRQLLIDEGAEEIQTIEGK